MSRTNIHLDDALLRKAFQLTHLKTKKELVHYALDELVKKEERKKILTLQGKLKWKGSFKKMRTTRKWSS